MPETGRRYFSERQRFKIAIELIELARTACDSALGFESPEALDKFDDALIQWDLMQRTYQDAKRLSQEP